MEVAAKVDMEASDTGAGPGETGDAGAETGAGTGVGAETVEPLTFCLNVSSLIFSSIRYSRKHPTRRGKRIGGRRQTTVFARNGTIPWIT